MDHQSLIGLALIIGWIVFLGGPAVLLGQNKNRSLLVNFLLGIFLGPIGWLITWKMRPPLTSEEKETFKRETERKRSSGSEW